MKKSEIDALKKAFDIPEPQRKDSFVLSYKEKLKKNNRKLRFPIAFRYASAAAAAALVIGLWGTLNQTIEFRSNFDNCAVITESTAPPEETDEIFPESGDDSPTTVPDVSEAPDNIQPENIILPDEYAPPAVTTAVSSGQNEIALISTSATACSGEGTITETTSAPAMTETVNSQTGTISVITVTTAPSESPDVPPATATTAEQTETLVTTVATEEPEYSPITTTAEIEFEPVPQITTAATTQDSQSSMEDSVSGRDFTVSPSVIYTETSNSVDISDYLETDDSEFDTESTAPPSAAPENSGWQAMACNSDCIVYASIDEIIYTEVDGKPYTQENLTIYSIYKNDGTLCPSDRVSVYLPGGYMPAEEFLKNSNILLDIPENSVIYDSGGSSGEQQVNSTYIFFLKNGSGSIPSAAFQLTAKTDVSVFKYSNGKYVSLGNSTLSFTKSELQEFLG